MSIGGPCEFCGRPKDYALGEDGCQCSLEVTLGASKPAPEPEVVDYKAEYESLKSVADNLCKAAGVTLAQLPAWVLARAYPQDDGGKTPGPAWVSIRERLPEEGRPVLIYVPTADEEKPLMMVCIRWKRNWVPLAYGWQPHITHWMPLPDGPNAKVKKKACPRCKGEKMIPIAPGCDALCPDCYGEEVLL